MPFSIIPFLLLVIPLSEIALFVVIGSQIGVLPTIGLVLATAVTGAILLRVQGFGVAMRVHRSLGEGRVPGRDLVHGVMILVAGLLLLTPGFITDTLGLLLFIPAVRDAGWTFLRDRIVIIGRGRPDSRDSSQGAAKGRTIDLEMGEYSSTENPEPPWRKDRDERE